MALRLIQYGNAIPHSWPVDPTVSFEPGQVAQLVTQGNQIVATVSDGTAPIGVIDDIRTKAFSATAWDETIIVQAAGTLNGAGKWVTSIDVIATLQNPNISPNSFISLNIPVALNARNGVIVFPAGTELNLDQDGDGIPDALKTVVRYTYQVPNIPGDDSTQGSGRVTIWFNRMILETDKYETNVSYPVSANLFVSEGGLFTTRQPTTHHPSVGIVTAPPSPMVANLQLIWL